ncbi:hypothetical protein DYB26_007119 [Aphanomyces astaci]|uniref:Spindle assembly abnormal protein 6 N-terminal domain-containing protein n=1 Tax=Aphanomyces astaci TaxID=112090 RepID=A0A397F6D0_APHAT|nr:hypothetical protein DYB31_011401 [Aphanomyces astaci]RHZ29510.1 hypothetical protein DYB26_007119 [Aphanomyces astaci]
MAATTAATSMDHLQDLLSHIHHASIGFLGNDPPSAVPSSAVLAKAHLQALKPILPPHLFHPMHSMWRRGRPVYWLDVAGAVGRLDWVDWLHRRGDTCSTLALDLAAGSGSIACVHFLHKVGNGGATTLAMNLAARFGHLAILRFLHTRRSEGCTSDALYFAAKYGHEEVVQFLATYCLPQCMPSRALDVAARHGHYGIVQIIHAASSHLPSIATTDAMDMAAAAGHLYIVCFLHEHRHEGCTEAALMTAAARGHLTVVHFLCENRDEGCIAAALEVALEHQRWDISAYLASLLDRHATLCSRIGCHLLCEKQWSRGFAGDENDLKALKIELSTETDLFFYYAHVCDLEGFHLVQEQQKLMVDFSDYANVLIRMLNNCIKEPHNHIAVYLMQADGRARLDFIQNMEYKFVELLSVDFARSPEEIVRQHITFRYNTVKVHLYSRLPCT